MTEWQIMRFSDSLNSNAPNTAGFGTLPIKFIPQAFPAIATHQNHPSNYPREPIVTMAGNDTYRTPLDSRYASECPLTSVYLGQGGD